MIAKSQTSVYSKCGGLQAIPVNDSTAPANSSPGHIKKVSPGLKLSQMELRSLPWATTFPRSQTDNQYIHTAVRPKVKA